MGSIGLGVNALAAILTHEFASYSWFDIWSNSYNTEMGILFGLMAPSAAGDEVFYNGQQLWYKTPDGQQLHLFQNEQVGFRLFVYNAVESAGD